MITRHALLALALSLALLSPLAPSARAAGAVTVYVEPRDGVAPLVSFIAGARRVLDGEVYELTSKPVEAAFVAAARRGVAVRIALEPHLEGASRSLPIQAYRTLAAGGAYVEWTSSMFTYTHAKYLVADGSHAWIGSPNWTAAASKSNREFAVVDPDPGVAGEA
jgi:phosphatidylserine/phosphatidylglycerophosphate/cardiolipin synthase-like enzyme